MFRSNATANEVVLSRDKAELRFSPAEGEKATYLIGIALSMETMDSVPSHITNSPFVVRFFQDDSLALERSDKAGSIPFTFHEGDNLIKAIRLGVQTAVNDRALNRGSVKSTSTFRGQENPF